MKKEVKITYDYILNILRSTNGDKFLDLLYNANPTSIREDLKYAKVFKNEGDNLEEWDICRKETTAKFIHNEYVEGNLKIPQSIYYQFPEYNLSILDRVKYNAVHHLFFTVLNSNHGYIFDNLIQITNNEQFNNNLLSVKNSVLKNSIKHPDFLFTEKQSQTLLCAVAEYLTDTYIDDLLILDNAALSILENFVVLDSSVLSTLKEFKADANQK
jgi:hypothetical protein